MQISELWRYPVKSMAGEQLTESELTLAGIPGDRGYYVRDFRGKIVSARTRAKLLGLHATIDAATGTTLVDGLPWDAPETAALVEQAAGPGARIVPAEGPERFDILPLLVATDGALEAFGHDYRRLRPNIVVAGVPGLTERTWEQRALRMGGAVVGMLSLRERCITTTYDPDTLAQDVGVLQGINDRFGGTLALNAWAGQPGLVRVGDPVTLLETPVRMARPELGRFAQPARS